MTPALPIKAIHHIGREVTDVERSLAFYRDVLSFRQVWRPNFAFDGAWLFNYGVQIHLIKGAPPPRSAEIFTRSDHLALYVDDIDACEQLLKDHGVTYCKNHVADTGVTQLFFHDPDGNHIELGTYPPTREIT